MQNSSLSLTVLVLFGAFCATASLSSQNPQIHVARGTQLDHSVSRSYSDRIADAWALMIVGFIIFTLSFPFVVLVEWDSVAFLAMLSRMRKVCYSVPGESVQDKHDNFGAIHVTGKLISKRSQQDSEVGFFPQQVVALNRYVEKMVKVEYRSKNKNTYHYEYRLEWREVSRPDLHLFSSVTSENVPKESNPSQDQVHRLHSALLMDSSLGLGAFELDQNTVRRIPQWEDCDLFQSEGQLFRPQIDGFRLQTASEAWSEKRPAVHERFWSWFKPISATAPQSLVAEIHQNEHPATYALWGTGREEGSIRISYKALTQDAVVSFCAVQTRNTLRRFQMDFDGITESRPARMEKVANKYDEIESAAATDEDPDDIEWKRSRVSPCCYSWRDMMTRMRMWTGSIFPQKLMIVRRGSASQADMFHSEFWACQKRVWLMRVWGFFGFTLGFYLMLFPVWEVVSFLPWIDFLLSHLFWVVSILVGFLLIVTVASTAYLLFHPEYMGLLLVIVGLAFHFNAVLGPECTVPEGEMHSGGAREFQSCSRDLLVGWVLLAASLAPLSLFAYKTYDEWRYAALVEEGLKAADKARKA